MSLNAFPQPSAYQLPPIQKRSAANDRRFYSSSFHTALDAKARQTPKIHLCHSADMGEVMGAIEDLWLRIARNPALRLVSVGDTSTQAWHVHIRVDEHSLDGEGQKLIEVVSEKSFYQWSQCGDKGSLVTDLQWKGNTLTIELASLHRMRQWPIGETLVLTLQALLQRLKYLGR